MYTKNTNLRNLIILFLVSVGVFLTSDVYAFNYRVCNNRPIIWEGDSVKTYRILGKSFPSGTYRRSDLESAFDEWNDVYGMWNIFSYYGTSSGPSWWMSRADGINHVYYESYKKSDNALATTFRRYSWSCSLTTGSVYIKEADITFNDRYSLRNGTGLCNRMGSSNDMRATALHELGHAFGLDHTSSSYSVMGTHAQRYVKYCYDHAFQPDTDDTYAGRSLYGSGNATVNLAVSSSNAEDGYGRMNNGHSTRNVCPGDKVSVNITVSNNGNVGSKYDLSLYLSTNRYISIYDLSVLDLYGGYLGAYGNMMFDVSFTVPRSVRPGETYYIGSYVDPKDKVREQYETDNRTYSQILLHIDRNCHGSRRRPGYGRYP